MRKMKLISTILGTVLVSALICSGCGTMVTTPNDLAEKIDKNIRVEDLVESAKDEVNKLDSGILDMKVVYDLKVHEQEDVKSKNIIQNFSTEVKDNVMAKNMNTQYDSLRDPVYEDSDYYIVNSGDSYVQYSKNNYDNEWRAYTSTEQLNFIDKLKMLHFDELENYLVLADRYEMVNDIKCYKLSATLNSAEFRQVVSDIMEPSDDADQSQNIDSDFTMYISKETSTITRITLAEDGFERDFGTSEELYGSNKVDMTGTTIILDFRCMNNMEDIQIPEEALKATIQNIY